MQQQQQHQQRYQHCVLARAPTTFVSKHASILWLSISHSFRSNLPTTTTLLECGGMFLRSRFRGRRAHLPPSLATVFVLLVVFFFPETRVPAWIWCHCEMMAHCERKPRAAAPPATRDPPRPSVRFFARHAGLWVCAHWPVRNEESAESLQSAAYVVPACACPESARRPLAPGSSPIVFHMQISIPSHLVISIPARDSALVAFL